MAEEGDWYNKLPTQFLRRLVSSILKEQEFDPRTVYCRITSILAGLWISSVYRLNIISDTKTMSLFIKCLPMDIQRINIFDSHLQFKNEVMFYNKVLTDFIQFQREKLQDSYAPTPVPKCYSAETDGENDVLVMEDLSSTGFVVLSSLKVMGLHELGLVMRELGRFHALSLAMKAQNPDRFVKIRECIFETVFSDSTFKKISRDIIEFILEDVLEILRAHYSPNSSYLMKFERFLVGAANRVQKLAHDSTNEFYNVITHGDLWVRNIMFHYPPGSPGNEPDEMRFLDFQQTRYASPATDVGKILFVAMDKPMRDIHRDDLLRRYHDSLSEAVRQLGSDPEKLFPFSAVEQQIRHSAHFIIVNALLNLPHALDESEGSDEDIAGDGPDDFKAAIRSAQQRMATSCKQRIIEIIEESVDRGYIN